jgi:hypothetical protein
LAKVARNPSGPAGVTPSGHDWQVDVIGHQAVGPDCCAGARCRGDQSPIQAIVVRLEKHRLAPITALGDMVGRPAQQRARSGPCLRLLPPICGMVIAARRNQVNCHRNPRNPARNPAKVGPADIEENLEFILQPNQPFQLKVSADLEVSAPETNFTSMWRSPLFHELDYLSSHQNSEIAYLNASPALRRYLLAGQIELTLGLSIDSNPVTRSIRVQIVLPAERSTEGRLLKNCVGFQNFGDFLIRWLAVRRDGVAQFFAELAPPEPSP